MNIPLNQIYNFLDGLIDGGNIIYRFSPHGSRNLEDLTSLNTYPSTHQQWINAVTVIMHDQEPLNFDFYNPKYLDTCIDTWAQNNLTGIVKSLEFSNIRNHLLSLNLGFIRYGTTLHDTSIICHSEKRSPEIEKYTAVGLTDVYWWSHAIIAQDWYRYAQNDPLLRCFPSPHTFDFNVYNRAWAGTREYRLKFADLVIENNLVASCNLTFNQVDADIHYTNHQYVNSNFVPKNNLSMLPPNIASSADSASYSANDYQQCWFDVVLETLFDDPRLHLTEKILRPIACGKPFILAGTVGSLEYLKSYGFRTFGEFIDESYDLETDPVKRLEKIILLMKQIKSLSILEKQLLNTRLAGITEYNKNRFFSNNFSKYIIDEFTNNYTNAYEVCNKNKLGNNWLTHRQLANKNPNLKTIIGQDNSYRTRKDIADMIRYCRSLKSCQQRQSSLAQE